MLPPPAYHIGYTDGANHWTQNLASTAWALLESEVSLGLLAGAEPDTHQFLCHDLFKGLIKWR
jgi:hypothetical protein